MVKLKLFIRQKLKCARLKNIKHVLSESLCHTDDLTFGISGPPVSMKKTMRLVLLISLPTRIDKWTIVNRTSYLQEQPVFAPGSKLYLSNKYFSNFQFTTRKVYIRTSLSQSKGKKLFFARKEIKK